MPAVEALRSGLGALVRLALADLDELWRQVGSTGHAPEVMTNKIETHDVLHDLLSALIDTYGSAAATLAADWYDDERDTANPHVPFSAIPADIRDSGSHALVGWALETATDNVALRSLIAGGMQRRIANYSRRTIIESSLADPAADGWQRHATGDSCDWCIALAARGAVYTEETADFSTHDWCDCVAVCAFSGEERPVQPYTPSQRYRDDDAGRRQRQLDQQRFNEWIAGDRSEPPSHEAPSDEVPTNEPARGDGPVWSMGEDVPRIDDDSIRRRMRITGESYDEVIRRSTNARNGLEPGYDINCQRVIHAYELRRRGYDVTALPNLDEFDGSTYCRNYASWLDGGLERLDAGGRHYVTRATKQLVEDLLPDMAHKFVTDAAAFVRTEIEAWPIGARGFVRFSRQDGAGHVFNVERTADGVAVREAQVPAWQNVDLGEYTSQIRKSKRLGGGLHLVSEIHEHGDVSVVRVDDLEFNEGVLEAITWTGRKR